MSQTIFTDGLGYEGKITLTLKNNNRVLQSKTYKNNGRAQLFKFLGYCLIDSYEEARSLLPTKIMLLYNSANGRDYRSDVDPLDVKSQSEFRGLAQIPTIISDSIENQVKVVYSFEVPKSAIGGAFNQVALYGAGMTKNDINEFSAFYYLIDDYGVIEALDLSDWSPTTVLLIEWELTLSNKNTDNNNKTIPSTSTI
jgi:hypothetical protein